MRLPCTRTDRSTVERCLEPRKSYTCINRNILSQLPTSTDLARIQAGELEPRATFGGDVGVRASLQSVFESCVQSNAACVWLGVG